MTGEEPSRGREPTETADPGQRETRETEARPRPELRWVQIRDPKRMDELGRNGRVVESFFHEGYDAWEVLLVTYEGELSGNRRQNR